MLTIQESVLLIQSFSLDSYNAMGIKNWKMNYMNSNPYEFIKQVHIKKQEDTIWRNKSQKKQDQELTVAQIMNSLWPNSDLNWRK